MQRQYYFCALKNCLKLGSIQSHPGLMVFKHEHFVNCTVNIKRLWVYLPGGVLLWNLKNLHTNITPLPNLKIKTVCPHNNHRAGRNSLPVNHDLLTCAFSTFWFWSKQSALMLLIILFDYIPQEITHTCRPLLDLHVVQALLPLPIKSL